MTDTQHRKPTELRIGNRQHLPLLKCGYTKIVQCLPFYSTRGDRYIMFKAVDSVNDSPSVSSPPHTCFILLFSWDIKVPIKSYYLLPSTYICFAHNDIFVCILAHPCSRAFGPFLLVAGIPHDNVLIQDRILCICTGNVTG